MSFNTSEARAGLDCWTNLKPSTCAANSCVYPIVTLQQRIKVKMCPKSLSLVPDWSDWSSNSTLVTLHSANDIKDAMADDASTSS